jgi:copper chaperone
METLMVDGMTCGHCVAAVTKVIKADDPASKVRIDLASGTVVVESAQSRAALIKIIEQAGYTVRPQ